MRLYEFYKYSGVEWLGDVPSHWDVKSLQRLGKFRSGAGFPIDEQGKVDQEIPFFKVKDLGLANSNDVMMSSDSTISRDTSDQLGAMIFPVDTIVFAKVGAALLLNRFRLLGCESCIDNNMMGFTITDDELHPRFILLAMQRINFNELVNPGTVPSLNESQISTIKIAIPPLKEQQAIADYLDIETARIDGLIEAKHELIKLLMEYRQSVISDAVTKGLNPDAPLKPSGVEWLGDVPSYWQMKKVKFLAELVSEKTDSPIAGQRYIGLEHVESKTGRFIENTEGMQTEAESTVNLFNKGCVLFGKLRPYLAKAVVADTDGVCSSEFLVFSPSGMDAEYLKRCMLLDGFIKTVDASTFGAKMPRADWTFISQLNLPQPPLDEQQAISKHLDVETAKFDSLISHAEKEIDLLKELRASTIADAVLGRIKVF